MGLFGPGRWMVVGGFPQGPLGSERNGNLLMLSLRESEGVFSEKQPRGKWEVSFAVPLHPHCPASVAFPLLLSSSLCPLTVLVFFVFYLQVTMLLNSGKPV